MFGKRRSKGVKPPDGLPELPELSDELRARARQALHEGRFDLVEEVFAQRELDLAKLVENLRIYQAELEQQNQELRASRAELELAVGRFASLFSSTPIAELIVDDKGLIREVNPAAERLLALTGDRLRQHFLLRLIGESDRGALVEALGSAWGSQRADLIEIELRTVHGETFIGDVHLARLSGEADAAKEFICAIIDRRDAVQQRRILRDNLASLRKSRAELADRANALACLYDIAKLKLQPEQPTPAILQQITARLRAALPNPQAAAVRILLPGEGFEAGEGRADDLIQEIAFNLPDGDHGTLQVAYRPDAEAPPLTTASDLNKGLFEAVAGHLEGLFQNRAAQEALAQSREAYRVLAEFSPEWEYWLGPDGHYTYLSPACEQITGYPRAAFENDSGLLARLIHPDDRDRYLAHRDAVIFTEAHAQSTDRVRQQYRLRTHAGDWIWIDHLCAPVTGRDGRWLGRRGVNRDITAQKRAEAEVARMTRLYNTLSQSNQAIVHHASVETLLPRICRIVVEQGGHAACLISRRDLVTGRMIPAASTQATPHPRVSRPNARDPGLTAPETRHHPRLSHGLGLPLILEGATIGAMTVYSTDADFFTPDVLRLLVEIADDVAYALSHYAQEAARRRAEADLWNREHELAAIFRSAPIGIGQTQQRRIQRVNDYFADMLGYAPDELIGRDARILYEDDAEYQRVGREKYAQIAATGLGTIETQWRHRDGHRLDILLSSSLIEQSNPDASLVFTALDVTESKRTVQALKESEERLRLTLQATNDGIWDWDIPTGYVTVNDRFFRMLGYAPNEFEPKIEPLMAMIHSEDLPGVRAILKRHNEEGNPCQVEYRMQCKDGRWIWILARGRVVAWDGEGRPARLVGSNIDISARKSAELALQESNRRLQKAEQIVALGHWQLDIASGEVHWSEQIYRIFGLDPNGAPPPLGEHARLFHPDDYPAFRRLLEQSQRDGTPFQFRLRILRADDQIRWLEAHGEAVRDASGRLARLFGTAQDITEDHMANERLRLAAQVFESTADAILITDPEQRVQAVNQAFSAITGHAAEAIQGQTLKALQVGRRDENLFRPLWAILTKTDRWQGQRWCQRKDGQPFCARISVTTVTAADGAPLNHIIVFGDITSLHQTRQELDHLTHHDALTGLPNRNLFRLRLEHGLQRAARDATSLAVLILDINRFRVVNESLGTAAGDTLLKRIGMALLAGLRNADTLARFSGDELGLLLEDLTAPHEAAEIAGRLLERCAQPQTIEGHHISVTASIGIAVFPSDGEDDETLLRHADIALKRAKAQGPNGYLFYEAAMDEDGVARLQIESCLREALIAPELHLHYQPQVRLDDGQLVGAEALLRWDSPQLGRVPPGRFIPIAEEMGMIGEIGLWVLTQGCEQLAAWDRQGHHLPRLAINLSIQQLEQPDLIGQIEQVLARTGIDPARLDLEITESLIMRQAEQSIATLNSLRELGLRLVIDDFGTGYSSLAYLRRLPLQQLKIDKSFVDDLTTDANSQAVANAVIALGKSLGLEILAEGIEYPEQAAWLLEAGCELAQGYHYARPLPPDALAAHWLANKT